ncbi:MAG: hypothetical protein V9G04_17805 [Nocardioides sp.]
MFVASWLIVAVLAFALIFLGLISVIVIALNRSAPGSVVREDLRVLLVRALGLTVGAASALWCVYGVAPFLELGRGAMLAPVALGIGVLLGAILGETVARRRPRTGVRSASLDTRRIRDHLPRALTAAVGINFVGALALLAFTTASAHPDDAGRTGRTLWRACTTAYASARGPYPGSFYSLWLSVGLLIALGLALIAARQVVLRPRGVAADTFSDDVLRRRSVAAVVAGLGVAVAAPTFGVSAVAGIALGSHSCAATSWILIALGAACLALLSLAVVVWSAFTLLAPGIAVRSRAPGRAQVGA